MIKINIEKDSEKIKNITITGHANYDDFGKDIVCAAVSASTLTTMNGIIALNNSTLEIINKKDKMIINIKEYDNISQVLLNNLISCLKDLEIEYPKNIKIYD